LTHRRFAPGGATPGGVEGGSASREQVGQLAVNTWVRLSEIRSLEKPPANKAASAPGKSGPARKPAGSKKAPVPAQQAPARKTIGN